MLLVTTFAGLAILLLAARHFARPSLTPSSVGDDFASEQAAPRVDADERQRMIRKDIIDLFRVPAGKKGG